MRMYLKILAGTLLFFVVDMCALPTSAPACDTARDAYCGLPTKRKLSVPHQADICFMSDKPDKVALLFFYKNGTLRPHHPTPVRQAGVERTCFKVGPSFIDERTERIVLCNGRYSVVIEGHALEILRAHGGMTATEYACLKGAACKQYRGKRGG